MLKEILGVADDPPARRRWFHDDYFDLFVWQAGGEVTLIQVCYGADATERALVWDKQRGFFQDGPPAPQEVFSRFEDAAATLPEEVRREVREKMHEFAGRRLAVLSRRKRFRRASWQRSAGNRRRAALRAIALSRRRHPAGFSSALSVRRQPVLHALVRRGRQIRRPARGPALRSVPQVPLRRLSPRSRAREPGRHAAA